MRLPTPTSSEIQSEIIDIHGYLTFAVYIHYFLPGSLKIRTKLYRVRLGQVRGLFERSGLSITAFKTRRVEGERWLAKTEMPYPGYCRAPGSAKCLDTLCNCKALDEQWQKYVEKQKFKNKCPK